VTASAGHYTYEPDYEVPPGETLNEVLSEKGMTQAELARRAGLSAKHVNQISLGLAAISPEIALRLERVTNVPARLWINLEADYQVARTRREEGQRFEPDVAWLRTLPATELARRGWIRKDSHGVEQLRDVLAFFKVATPAAWQQVWATPTVYRRSRAFETDYGALAAWLRIGELRAEGLAIGTFDRSRFRDALLDIRRLTLVSEPHVWLPQLTEICAHAGVGVVIEREITGARINGAVRWLASDQALIQLSLRHRWADIFWFTLFHEAGHLLLHDRKKLTFVDAPGKASTDDMVEREADDFAARVLLPHALDSALARVSTETDVRKLATEAGVHPGIVVGRLQHDGRIGFNRLNQLRVRFAFADEG
jgi:HTH-type transcriptional regulator/antitoxin HigA